MKNINIFLTALILFISSSSIFSQGGELDPNFNNANISLAGLDINATGIWGGGGLQNDDKIIAFIVEGFSSKLVRYNKNGSIDDTFGIIESQEGGRILKVMDDNKIFMGTASGKVEKYNEDGTLDISFDNSNHFLMYVYGIDVQADGKVIVTGRRQDNNWDDVVARYNSDGTVDSNFGDSGQVVLNNFESDWSRSIIALSDGSILMQGASLINMPYVTYFVKLDADGNLDANFGNDGVVFLTEVSNNNSAYTSTVLSDGKIVVAGGDWSDGNKIFIARLNPDGTMDDTFGTNGFVFDATFSTNPTESFGTTKSVIQSDGKIIVHGDYTGESNNNTTSYALKRYNEDGSIDNNFGFDGFAFAYLDEATTHSFSLDIDSDGNYVQIGNARYSNSTSDIAVAKFLCCMDVGTLNFGLEKQSLLVYPNPIESTTTLSFSLENEQPLDIFLTDVNGKLIKTFFSQQNFIAGEHQLNLTIPTSLSPGIYFLTLKNNQSPVSIQVFKK